MRGIICKRRISLHIVEDISNNNTAEAFKRFALIKSDSIIAFSIPRMIFWFIVI